MTKLLVLSPLLAFTLLFCGCATMRQAPAQQDNTVRRQEDFSAFNGEYSISDSLKHHPPRSIAVLPFGGDPSDWDFEPDEISPTDVVRAALYNHLAYLPFRDVELADVDARLARAGLLSPAEIALELDAAPRRLRSILGVDAVITGRVTHFDRVYVGLLSQVAVGCEVAMTDLATGEVLWSARHVSRELGGGVAISPVGLALNALASAWNLRTVQLYRQADDVFREIVSTLAQNLPQTPALADLPQPPRIDLFVASPSGRVARSGEGVQLSIVGDEGLDASAVLTRPDGTVFRDIRLAPMPRPLRSQAIENALAAMSNRADGTALPADDAQLIRDYLGTREFYEATLPVPPGEEAYGLAGMARLARADGAATEMPLATGRLSLDGLPPTPPTQVRVDTASHKARARWTAPEQSSGTVFTVQAGPALGGPYPLEARTGSTDFTFKGLDNFETIFVRVAAEDRAGNRSSFSSPVRAMPAPEHGLAGLPTGAELPDATLAGHIARPMLLLAQDGPYTVRNEVLVGPGGALYVGPGAEFRFAPGARLVVRGGTLAAYGEPDRPVRMLPEQDNAPPGAFAGIVLDAPERADLMYVDIRNAATALRITHAAPTLHGIGVAGAGQAALSLGDGARPLVTCSRFTGNQGMGALLTEGKGLAPRLRDNLFSGNTPFDVQNFSGVELDLTGNAWGANAPAPGRFLGPVNAARPIPYLPASCQEGTR